MGGIAGTSHFPETWIDQKNQLGKWRGGGGGGCGGDWTPRGEKSGPGLQSTSVPADNNLKSRLVLI